MIFRTALTNSHQISISGGTDATTYMASISRLNQEGVVKDTGVKRTNISLNITQKLGSWLTVGMGTKQSRKITVAYRPVSPMLCFSLLTVRCTTLTVLCATIRWMKHYTRNPFANEKATSDKVTRNIFISTFAEAMLPVKGLSFRTNFRLQLPL